MKKMILGLLVLSTASAFASHTTLDCVDTTSLISYSVKVKQAKVKLINRQNSSVVTYDLIGTTPSGGRRYYGNEKASKFVSIQNRNWEESLIDLYEQIHINSGIWIRYPELIETKLQLDCLTVLTLDTKF